MRYVKGYTKIIESLIIKNLYMISLFFISVKSDDEPKWPNLRPIIQG